MSQGHLQEAWRAGPIPVHHHTYEREGKELYEAVLPLTVQIVGRLEGKDQVGHWIISEMGAPHLIGAVIWPDGGRGLPATARAWPAQLIKKTPTGDAQALPLLDKRFTRDTGFDSLEVFLAEELPAGTRGIVLDSTDQRRQEPLFLASDNRLVDQWRGEDPPRYSSRFHEITADGELDLARWAGVDTAWRITKPKRPRGSVGVAEELAQVLAWNNTASPSGQGFGMMVGRTLEISLPTAPPAEPVISTGTGGSVGDQYDKIATGRSSGDDYDGVTVTPGDLAIAYWSVEKGGPGYVGAGVADKHSHGLNPDGEPIGPAHIQGAANFFYTIEMDAPLQHTLRHYPGAAVFQKNAETWLMYDGKASHPGLDAEGKVKSYSGLHRWLTKTPWKPSTPGVPIPPHQPPSMVIPDGQGGGQGGGNGGAGPGAGQGGGQGGDALWPRRDEANKENQKGAATIARLAPHIVEQALRAQARNANQVRRPTQVAGVEADNEMGWPATCWRPMKTGLAGGDLRYADTVTVQQVEDREKAPIVARDEAFGAGDWGQIAIWTYTQDPGNGRYIHGTAAGGTCWLPPELGVEDILTTATIPEITTSATYKAAMRGTSIYHAWDLDGVTGLPVDGYKTSQDGAGGDLQQVAVGSDGAEIPQITYKPDGVVRFERATEHPVHTLSGGGPFTIDENMHAVVIDNNTAGVAVVNLPASDATTQGRVYQVKRVNAGGAARSLDITPAGADQIDGGGVFRLRNQWDSATVKADGAGNWFVY